MIIKGVIAYQKVVVYHLVKPVSNKDHQCGERQCENKQDSEEFYLILKGILEELNFIKKQQEYILKELIVRK